MDIYATEEQQVEAIKKWFKKYGNTILWAITIVLAILAGMNYWRHHQEVVREQASENYIGLMQALEQNDKTTAKSKADQLQKEYANSAYATLGSLMLAKELIADNELNDGKQYLQWVNEHSKQQSFQALARLRLMRILIDENKLADALNLYDEKIAGDYLTLMAELKGDILLKQNDKAGAVKAYETAYKAAPQEGMYGPLLKMKLENVGVDLGKISKKPVDQKEAVK